ncbi:hypothetical protein MTO96_012670 [Rhipicephalus appendiculatus]
MKLSDVSTRVAWKACCDTMRTNAHSTSSNVCDAGRESCIGELAKHYVAGCSAGGSSRHTENTSSESRALTLQNVRNALEEVSMLLENPDHDQVLSVITSQVTELTEQVRKQESRLGRNHKRGWSTSTRRDGSTRGRGFLGCLAGTVFSAEIQADQASTSSPSLFCSQEPVYE